MQKLAIFGGTFNPIHWGHLVIAETALSQLALDRVFWVPTYHPPHKDAEIPLSYEHRSEMVKLAVADHPSFSVSPIEHKQTGKSFAINTLQALQALHDAPDIQWYWIVGLDSFQTLPRWYGRQELAKSCNWLVAPRPDQTGTSQSGIAELETISAEVVNSLAAQSIQIHWQMLQMPILGISSSLIRAYCRQKRSIRYLVPESVKVYIDSHYLY